MIKGEPVFNDDGTPRMRRLTDNEALMKAVAATSSMPGESADAVQGAIDDEIRRLSKFILSNLATTLDTPFSRMDYTQTHIYADTPEDYFEQQESLARRLTPEILAGMARRYFDLSKMIVVTAGN